MTRVLDHHTASRLWRTIRSRLDRDLPRWTQLVEHFGQVAAVERRESGARWRDNEVFEALVRAVLSNNTDWAKVDGVIPELGNAFFGFSLNRYADATDTDIESIVAWFEIRKAGSMTLKRSLVSLAQTARVLRGWSIGHGSAENYFLEVISSSGGDPNRSAIALGDPGSVKKLSALGIPIAAESLRNLGFDVSKPDRHVCRAMGSFDLVQFRRWPDRTNTKAPAANAAEMLETMAVVETLARLVDARPTLVDTAIWLLCARMGLYLSNAQLRSMVAAP